MNALSATSFDRRDERTHLFLVATLYSGAASAPVRVRNLSPSGALVEALGLPPAGSAVVLRRGPLEAAGTVAWSSAERAGLSFHLPVTVSAWLPTKEKARQAQVDQIAFRVKHASGGTSALPSVVAGPSLITPEAAVADLIRLQAELGELADLLARDPLVVAAHPEIQWFDAAEQRMTKIVAALRAPA